MRIEAPRVPSRVRRGAAALGVAGLTALGASCADGSASGQMNSTTILTTEAPRPLTPDQQLRADIGEKAQTGRFIEAFQEVTGNGQAPGKIFDYSGTPFGATLGKLIDKAGPIVAAGQQPGTLITETRQTIHVDEGNPDFTAGPLTDPNGLVVGHRYVYAEPGVGAMDVVTDLEGHVSVVSALTENGKPGAGAAGALKAFFNANGLSRIDLVRYDKTSGPDRTPLRPADRQPQALEELGTRMANQSGWECNMLGRAGGDDSEPQTVRCQSV